MITHSTDGVGQGNSESTGRHYSYNPSFIVDNGLDKMRFELGDTMVEGRETTCALSDEELQAVLSVYPTHWKKAKLYALESICRRLAYEPDTRVDQLSFTFGNRAKMWREDYEKLKKELAFSSAPRSNGFGNRMHQDSYFYTGMMQNPETGGKQK